MVNKVPHIKLNNNLEMPQFGLGVFKVKDGEEVEKAVITALQSGYRLIDTAAVYENEEGVGRAIASSGIPREELFITTKLWNDEQGYESAIEACNASIEKLGLEYVDLYLIHWPKPSEGKIKDTWRAFEELLADGKVRAIGVSNFKPDHLQELLDGAEIVPAVNQIELHPFLTQLETREYCADHGIEIESYSPLMRGGELLENEVIAGIADKYKKTPAQVVLRWHIQSGLIVIPKSVTPERIRSNIDIFDFEMTAEDMNHIDGLNKNKRVGGDPDTF